ncbi:MAG: hypothetical protein ACYCXA_04655 [Actinomycetes bacterium]
MLEQRHSTHPVVKATVALAAGVFVVLLALSAVSVVVGLVWTLVKAALLVLVVVGAWHIVRRSRAHG